MLVYNRTGEVKALRGGGGDTFVGVLGWGFKNATSADEEVRMCQEEKEGGGGGEWKLDTNNILMGFEEVRT